jgi:hypothetical protein
MFWNVIATFGVIFKVTEVPAGLPSMNEAEVKDELGFQVTVPFLEPAAGV